MASERQLLAQLSEELMKMATRISEMKTVSQSMLRDSSNKWDARLLSLVAACAEESQRLPEIVQAYVEACQVSREKRLLELPMAKPPFQLQEYAQRMKQKVKPAPKPGTPPGPQFQ